MKRLAWRYALIAFGAVIVAYYLLSGEVTLDVMYDGLGLASVVAILVGVRLHRPANPWPWLAFAAGNLLFVAGDVVLDGYDVMHVEAPYPSIADALYLAGYPALVAALLLWTKTSRGTGNRENHADAAIVAAGALALLWQLLVGGYAHDSVPLAGKLVTMAYPIMDVAVLFILVRVLLVNRVRHVAAVLMTVSIAAMFVADIGYDLLLQNNSYHVGSICDAGWLISYALAGAAALHPSMAQPIQQSLGAVDTRRRLPLVALSGFVPPILFVGAGVAGWNVDTAVVGGISAVLFALVIVRMSWLFDRMHKQTVFLTEQSQALDAALAAQHGLQDTLRRQAFQDSLTGLANRALLRNRAEHALASGARGGEVVALLFCDLDGFKTVNDSLGHQAGDQLLRTIGERLQSVVRPEDTVARLGGDEFAVLIPHLTDPAVAADAAERIRAVASRPSDLAGTVARVTASVGVAFGGPGKSVDALLSEADAAMYVAKADGKDRVEIYAEQMRHLLIRRLSLRNCFEDGLQSGQFHLAFQPQVHLADGRLVGFEALARWTHPEHGVVSPAEFIPLAEETGLIVPLGRWVLESACVSAASWQRPGCPPVAVSVNISMRQLQQSTIVDDVAAALSYSGLAPDLLTLEVTESVLSVDPARTSATLRQLKDLGLNLAIDDFGTGYSSLSYLRDFPVDVIKIDKSFVDPLGDPSTAAHTFVGLIIDLAHQLGMSTVAEGVEDDAQREKLLELSCDDAQGYLWSVPLAEDAALDFARREHGRVAAPLARQD